MAIVASFVAIVCLHVLPHELNDQSHALVGHLDRVRVTELVGCWLRARARRSASMQYGRTKR